MKIVRNMIVGAALGIFLIGSASNDPYRDRTQGENAMTGAGIGAAAGGATGAATTNRSY